MKKIAALFVILLSFQVEAQTAQQEDSLAIRKIYDLALLQGKSYEWLDHLSNKIGGRLSGSVSAQQAVDYTKAELEAVGLDKVWLQPVMVPKWTRGNPEYAYVQTQGGPTNTVNILALGGSVATPETGLRAKVLEVQGIEDLAHYGKEQIQGKIVFFNRPMPADLIHTFSAYGACVDQRYSGAAEAAKFGAAGVIVRSLTHKIDEHPHTGSMSYGDLPNDKRIPAAAISTNDAEYLSGILKLQNDA